MKFIDQTEIHVTAGNGGDGISSFRSARNKPKLGPDGGNGGNGGNILLIAEPSLNTLSSLRYRQVYRGEHGGKGQANNKTGRCGRHKTIRVPRGTVVYDRDSGEVLGELIEPGQQLLVAQGGKRGYGNLNYVSATNRAPYFFTHGQKGAHKTLRLELKLLADVGLAGFPNAGKSTLLSRLSAAKPKIADYPFTTLVPNLGVVELGEHSEDSFVIADVPGLIEGASSGKGLGLEFLRHLERTKVIAFVVDTFDMLEPSPLASLEKLKEELKSYSPKMLEKEAVIVLNKLDLSDAFPQEEVDRRLSEIEQAGYPILQISAVSGAGLGALKRALFEYICNSEPDAKDMIYSACDNQEFSSERESYATT
ncbi:MAG: GTPase ObgE [Oligoflexales bacterium]